MKFKKWRWPVVFSIMLLALFGYGLSQQRPEPQRPEPPAERAPASQQELPLTILARGVVELMPGMEITSQLNGHVAEVLVAEGEAVSAGQTLFTVQSKTDHAALQKARAATAQADARFRKISEQTQAGSELSLKRAKAALDSAKKQYTRTGDLAAKGMVSQQHAADALRNLTIAQNQLTTTQFQAKAMRAKGSDYALAEIALNKAKEIEKALRDKARKQSINAEADGILISCKVARGDQVTQSKILALITPADAMRVMAQIDAQDLQNFKPGQRATIAVQGQAERYPAILSSVKPATDRSQGNVEFKFAAIKQAANFAAGTVLSLEIEVPGHAGVLSTTGAGIEQQAPDHPARAG